MRESRKDKVGIRVKVPPLNNEVRKTGKTNIQHGFPVKDTTCQIPEN